MVEYDALNCLLAPRLRLAVFQAKPDHLSGAVYTLAVIESDLVYVHNANHGHAILFESVRRPHKRF